MLWPKHLGQPIDQPLLRVDGADRNLSFCRTVVVRAEAIQHREALTSHDNAWPARWERKQII